MKSIKIDNHRESCNRYCLISDINWLISIDFYRYSSFLIEYRNFDELRHVVFRFVSKPDKQNIK